MVTVGQAVHAYYESGAHKTQRFGQFYVNRCLPRDIVWPELYYEEDLVAACEMINERFFNYIHTEEV